MNYDYYADLSQQLRYDLDNVDAATVSYHYQATEDGQDNAKEVRDKWCNWRLDKKEIAVEVPDLWPILTLPVIDIDKLPPYSLILQCPFRLTNAYLSKDERDFYIVDNPVRKDKALKWPYVAPSSWKGSMRAALWKMEFDAAHPSVCRLFGNAKEETEHFSAGRLHFFPTFFNRLGLEIINPHDRERRVGVKPLFIESVPPGTTGTFTLLYVPFDAIGQAEAQVRKEVSEDLSLIARGVRAMFCTYGFGAKTSNGYGTAVDSFVRKRDRKRDNLADGHMQLKAILGEPKAIRAFRQEHARLDAFSSKDWKIYLASEEGGLQLYEAACKARQRHKENLDSGRISRKINSFGELEERLSLWSEALMTGQGGSNV